MGEAARVSFSCCCNLSCSLWLLQVSLNCTHHITNPRLRGMEWNEMEWSGVEWNGVEWNGVEWIEMECGMEWSRMEWSGMEWSGMGWNGLK